MADIVRLDRREWYRPKRRFVEQSSLLLASHLMIYRLQFSLYRRLH